MKPLESQNLIVRFAAIAKIRHNKHHNQAILNSINTSTVTGVVKCDDTRKITL
jgi:di/tripeptidase